MAELNAKWMDKPGPTDVLAFPMDELRPGEVDAEPEEGVLGDLVLCPAVAARQAETAGHSVAAELRAAHRARRAAPARLRPRRARRARRDVRSAGHPAGEWARRPRGAAVSGQGPWLLVLVVVLVVVAGLLSSAEAALSSFSRVRAEELLRESRPGAQRLMRVLDDPPASAGHHAAAAAAGRDLRHRAGHRGDLRRARSRPGHQLDGDLAALAGGAAVDPGDAGDLLRLHRGRAPHPGSASTPSRSALLSAGVLLGLPGCWARCPRLLILIGNAVTPGRGFRGGPVRLRGRAARAGRPGRGQPGDRGR